MKWTGPLNPTADVELVEVTSRFEIYALARAVELDGLEMQVRDEIEDIADRLDIFTVLDAIKEMYPTLIGNDTWFSPWVKSLIKKAFKNPGKLSKVSPSTDFGVDSSVVKLLLGCMLETFAEMATGLPGLDVVEPDTPITDGSFEDAGRDERPRPPQELPAMFRCDPQSTEPIPGPRASDKERVPFRFTLGTRKRPLWWLVLQAHSPPATTHRELVASEPAPEPVPEPALDEPAPVEDIDFLRTPSAKKNKKKDKKKVLVPQFLPTPLAKSLC